MEELAHSLNFTPLGEVYKSSKGWKLSSALAYAPNGLRFAAATSDRSINLFNERNERKDKFSLRSSTGQKLNNYIVTQVAWSPDSKFLAVGQTDSACFVYGLGARLGDKKSVTARFLFDGACTAVAWPAWSPDTMFAGLDTGEVVAAHLRGSQTTQVLKRDSPVTALVAAQAANRLFAVFNDGTVFLINAGSRAHTELVRFDFLPFGAYALGDARVLIVGAANRIAIVSAPRGGEPAHPLFVSLPPGDASQITAGAASPSYPAVALAGGESVYVVFHAPDARPIVRRVLRNPGLGVRSITSMAFRPDSTEILVGSACGGISAFSVFLSREVFRGNFVVTRTTLTRTDIKTISSGRTCSVSTSLGSMVSDVRLHGPVFFGPEPDTGDEDAAGTMFAICRTDQSLVVANLASGLSSEIPWAGMGKEVFVFDSQPDIALIFNAGELTVLHLGEAAALGVCRVYKSSSHLLSLRIGARADESLPPVIPRDTKVVLAHLGDSKRNIRVTDVRASRPLLNLTHAAAIDWVELSPNGTRLLFRDMRGSIVYCRVPHTSTERIEPRVLLVTPLAPYVQWVPGLEVVVAQEVYVSGNGDVLVWYSLDSGGEPIRIPSQGRSVIDIVRSEERGTAIVLSARGAADEPVEVPLDEGLIRFGEALERDDLEAATAAIQAFDETKRRAMSLDIAKIALNGAEPNFTVAARALAIRGELSKAAFCRRAARELTSLPREIRGVMAQAKRALLAGDLVAAERCLIDANKGSDAVALYRDLERFEDAVRVSKAIGMSADSVQAIEEEGLRWLLDTHQTLQAGKLLQARGDIPGALNLFLQDSYFKEAAALVRSNPRASYAPGTINELMSELRSRGMGAAAGAIAEARGELQKAMQYFREGKAFHDAARIARREFQGEVVAIEAEWGRSLVEQGRPARAVSHFIEAGLYSDAVGAAISAKNWPTVRKFLNSLPRADAQRYALRAAQSMSSAGMHAESIEWYELAHEHTLGIQALVEASEIDLACKLARENLRGRELISTCKAQASELEAGGLKSEAVRFLLLADLFDDAIELRARDGDLDAVLALVRQHRPERLSDTLCQVAGKAEATGDIATARQAFLEAGEWKKAVALYTKRGSFEEAIEITTQNGAPADVARVAFTWASEVGVEEAAPSLRSRRLLEPAIDHACQMQIFDRALRLAAFSATPDETTQRVRALHGQQLERDRHFQEAEREYVEAGRADAAVDMWLRLSNWTAASAVANGAKGSDLIFRVAHAQAEHALKEGDLKRAEQLFLECGDAARVIDVYKTRGLWNDALRVAKRYAPAAVRDIADEYAAAERAAQESGPARHGAGAAQNAQDLLGQARMQESAGNWDTAIEIYFRIAAMPHSDLSAGELAGVLKAACALSQKHQSAQRLRATVRRALAQLTDLHLEKAAIDLALRFGHPQDAASIAASVGLDERADEIVRKHNLSRGALDHVLAVRMNRLVEADDAEAIFLTGDHHAALEIFAARGLWERVLELVADLGGELQAEFLLKFAAAHADADPEAAVRALATGSPEPTPEPGAAAHLEFTAGLDVDAVLHVARCVLAREQTEPEWRDEVKSEFAQAGPHFFLRDVLYRVRAAVASARGRQKPGADAAATLERYFYAAHFVVQYCNHVSQERHVLAAHCALALTFYADVLPVDRTFTVAGLACRKVHWDAEALIFLNLALDIRDSLLGGDDIVNVDVTDIIETGIPVEFTTPSRFFLDDARIEDVRQWVMMVSMDRTDSLELTFDRCSCGAPVWTAAETCQRCGTRQGNRCVLSGSVVDVTAAPCCTCGAVAKRSYWNELVGDRNPCPMCGRIAAFE
eukprot:gnl/Chilomastix_cuspidata/775.p1 GENE.gnl/Chilomastix_cuspidata/775~~gnl/Chilomastix_cuspidata/775.p1  ORF type:complete len:1830 (+),score=796.01 gnl/Chilomastix_cuspidata/775:2075-7564(+)